MSGVVMGASTRGRSESFSVRGAARGARAGVQLQPSASMSHIPHHSKDGIRARGKSGYTSSTSNETNSKPDLYWFTECDLLRDLRRIYFHWLRGSKFLKLENIRNAILELERFHEINLRLNGIPTPPLIIRSEIDSRVFRVNNTKVLRESLKYIRQWQTAIDALNKKKKKKIRIAPSKKKKGKKIIKKKN
eukprot:Trichotokara_eunicae@DN3184_c0_g1_i3.p1